MLTYALLYRQLLKRNQYDSYLSSALGVPLHDYNKPPNEDDEMLHTESNNEDSKDKRLRDIDEADYVLTLDYTMKVCTSVNIYNVCAIY